jgi:hypothetical protein
VLTALQTKSPAAAAIPGLAPEAELPKPAAPPPAAPIMETVRRVTTLRHRSSSILGLDVPPAAE